MRSGSGKIRISDIEDGDTLGEFSFEDLEGDPRDMKGLNNLLESFANDADMYSKDELARKLFTEERRADSIQIRMKPGFGNIVEFDCSIKFQSLTECIIDWGDNSSNNVELYSNTPTQMKHTYADNEDKLIVVYGVFNLKTKKVPLFGKMEQLGTIIDIIDFGTVGTTLLQTNNLFENFKGERFYANNYPSFYNWENCKNWSAMFKNAINFNDDISLWEGSPTTIDEMFSGCLNFNKPVEIESSNLMSMNYTFNDCKKFNEVFKVDTSNVISAKGLFKNCQYFNQDINYWNVETLINSSEMFMGCNSFNSNINNWNLINLRYMANMFNGSIMFNSSLNNWNVSKVRDMYGVFKDAINFNADITSWNLENVNTMEYMFYGAEKFNQDLGKWDMSSVQNTSHMFEYAYVFNQDVSKWNMSNIIYCNNMFAYAVDFNQDLNKWDMSNVLSIKQMFNNADKFAIGPVEWNTENCVDMTGTFYNSDIQSQDTDFSNWNVNKVLKFYYFLNSDSLSNPPSWKI